MIWRNSVGERVFLLLAVAQAQQIVFRQRVAVRVNHFSLFGRQNGFARNDFEGVTHGRAYLQNAAFAQGNYDCAIEVCSQTAHCDYRMETVPQGDHAPSQRWLAN